MTHTNTKTLTKTADFIIKHNKGCYDRLGYGLKIVLKRQTLKQEIMEPSKKNKPATIVIIGIAAIVIAIISYFIFLTFFPDLFQDLPTGEQQPIKE